MSRGLSLYLDGIRVVAALVVLLSHWAYARFTDGAYLGIRALNLGSDAVVLFFVMSGLVIAHTAEAKDRTARAFLFSRATRVFSVAAPALLLGFVLDRTGAALAPAAYDGWWYQPLGLGETLFYGLSFSSQWLGTDVRLGSNGPYWSLSYEVAYYLLFAAVFYARGPARLLLAALVAVAAGPKVALLLPAWLAGVAAWRAIRAGRWRPRPRLVWSLAVLPPLAYVLALAAGLPPLLMRLTVAMLGMEPARVAALLDFSDEFLWNWLIAALAAVHVIAVAALFRRRAEPTEGAGRTPLLPRLACAVRWAAGASFSLYLVHYPVLQFADAVLPEAPWPPLRHLALLAAALAVCLAFARLFERPLPAFRARLLRLAGRRERAAVP